MRLGCLSGRGRCDQVVWGGGAVRGELGRAGWGTVSNGRWLRLAGG